MLAILQGMEVPLTAPIFITNYDAATDTVKVQENPYVLAGKWGTETIDGSPNTGKQQWSPNGGPAISINQSPAFMVPYTTPLTSLKNAFYMSKLSVLSKMPDTSNVTNMSHMFHNSEGLYAINESEIDTSSCTDMCAMFSGCYSLTGLDLSKWDTSKVTDMSYMFSSCRNLQNIDTKELNVANVKDMSGMFSDCQKIKDIYIVALSPGTGKFSDAVKHVTYMFDGVIANTITVMLDMKNVLNIYTMPGNPVGYGGMFENCTCNELYINAAQMNYNTSMNGMLANSHIKKIYLGSITQEQLNKWQIAISSDEIKSGSKPELIYTLVGATFPPTPPTPPITPPVDQNHHRFIDQNHDGKCDICNLPQYAHIEDTVASPK